MVQVSKFVAALCLSLAPLVATACDAEHDCKVATGAYRVRMPEAASPGTAVGAVMYFHGWRGSAAGVMRNKSLDSVVAELGLALIAPDGEGKTWSYPGSPRQYRDEFRFVREVLDDVAARFAVDPDRVIAAGFSMGGSMVWNLACYMGDRFQAFVPVAGAFWEPLPATCPSQLPRIFHVHGTADRVVPYNGRTIRSEFRQGDVGRSINVWMVQGGCPASGPSLGDIISSMPRVTAGAAGKTAVNDSRVLACDRHYACGTGLIELCIHSGGHSFRTEWLRQAWTWLQGLPGRN